MHYRQTVLVSMLAVAVTLAGVACACAVPTVQADDAVAMHHAHHGHDHAPENTGCDHADCGDCMAEVSVSKHDAVRGDAPQSPNVSLDDDGAAAAALAANISRHRGFSYEPPPLPRLVRAADTSVRRFDKLLN